MQRLGDLTVHGSPVQLMHESVAPRHTSVGPLDMPGHAQKAPRVNKCLAAHLDVDDLASQRRRHDQRGEIVPRHTRRL